jgi:6-phosphofructokinase 1
VPEKKVDFDEIINNIKDGRLHGRTNFNIIVAEGAASAQEVASGIEQEAGVEARVTVLGHVQRGGSPLLRDRIIASEMGVRAVKLLHDGVYGHVICFDGREYTDVELDESILQRRFLDEQALAILDVLKPR